jgi:hypothetical protein
MTRRNVVLTGLVAILCSAGSAAFAENSMHLLKLKMPRSARCMSMQTSGYVHRHFTGLMWTTTRGFGTSILSTRRLTRRSDGISLR